MQELRVLKRGSRIIRKHKDKLLRESLYFHELAESVSEQDKKKYRRFKRKYPKISKSFGLTSLRLYQYLSELKRKKPEWKQPIEDSLAKISEYRDNLDEKELGDDWKCAKEYYKNAFSRSLTPMFSLLNHLEKNINGEIVLKENRLEIKK